MKDNQAKYPQLRFKGFTDPWEQRKLGDYLSLPKKKKVEITNARDLMTLKLHLRGIEAGTGRETLSLGSTVYYKRSAGQFLYGKQNFFNGSMAIIPKKFDGKATSGDVPALDINGINSSYLYTYVSRHDYWKAKEGDASGTGSKRIHESTLLKFGIMVPVNNAEQQKIGSFFKQLDDTITLHQRKLDLLKEQKKGYLQKMFPKNGAKVPELRFAGFADDWVQRNLGEWSDVRDGTHASPKYIEQGHPMVTSKNLTDSGLDMSDVSYLTDEDFNEVNQRSKVDIGDILFGMIGTIGKPVIVDRDDFAIKNVALIKEKTSPEIINTWLIQYLKSPSFERFIQKENAGGTQKFIALGLIRDMKLMTPSVQEQARIGELLNHLDNLIAANQRKLDLLKEQKKGFLQNMFV